MVGPLVEMVVMLLWILFAVVTAGVLLAILRPLRVSGAMSIPSDSEYDAALYSDQLAELDRDAERGLISGDEREAARNEIGRRLLRAADGPRRFASPGGTLFERRVFAAVLFLLPALAVSLYLLNGSPGMPGLPYEQRMENAIANRDTDALIAKVENHLAVDPGDVAGWLVIARAYRSLGRFGDAAKAFSEAVSRSTPDATLLADNGEMIVMDRNGSVTSEARTLFRRARDLEPANPRARYYLALSLAQAGDTAGAVREWQALVNESPNDTPWRQFVQQRIDATKSGSVAPELTEDQMAEAQSMTAEEKAAMIGGMVEKLSDRLQQDGNDLEGWLRLARARAVLGEPAKARAALDHAAEIFKQDAAALARITDMRKTLPE